MLVVLGFFVVFPLISIRFVDDLGWAALLVGIALGLRQFIQQGLGIFGGAIADRFGAKPMIITGCSYAPPVLCSWQLPTNHGCFGCLVRYPASAARSSIRRAPHWSSN